MSRKSKQRARIRDWRIETDSFFRTDLYYLTGVVSGHPRQVEFEAERQRTSQLLRIDFEKNEAETRNTIYELVPL